MPAPSSNYRRGTERLSDSPEASPLPLSPFSSSLIPPSSLRWFGAQSEEPKETVKPRVSEGLAFARELSVAEVGQKRWGKQRSGPVTYLYKCPSPPAPACWTKAVPVTTSTTPAPASASRTKL